MVPEEYNFGLVVSCGGFCTRAPPAVEPIVVHLLNIPPIPLRPEFIYWPASSLYCI